jgi:anti-anti-sigma factor
MLTLGGELDQGTAPAITDSVGLAVDAGCDVLEVDLSEVTFVDCAALGELVLCNEALGAACARLRLHGLSRRVQRLMRLTHTDMLFEVADAAGDSPAGRAPAARTFARPSGSRRLHPGWDIGPVDPVLLRDQRNGACAVAE